ncbi:MAG: hypothetical protein NTX49_04510 [Chlamydiae bacterium]|nr:hypothetical protein [Chlamydiota bacterium]
MTIETNYSMQRFIGPQGPEEKYVDALERIRSITPGIKGEGLMSAFIKYMEKDPSDVYMSNEARESILQRNFLTLALPSLPASVAVETLRSCDTHLETLVFASEGHPGLKFSKLVLLEYSYFLQTSPEYKLGDSSEDNFDKNPVHRLLAIKAVFEKYLKNPHRRYSDNPELARVHADYYKVKEDFSSLLMLQGLVGLSPQRIPTPPKSDLTTPRCAAEEAEELRKKDHSPENGAARRAFIQSHFQKALSSQSPPRAAETPSLTVPQTESPEELTAGATSSPPPIEATVPETPVRAPEELTPKPSVDVTTPPRGPTRPRLVVTPAAARAMAAASKRAVTVAPDGKITCTIRK